MSWFTRKNAEPEPARVPEQPGPRAGGPTAVAPVPATLPEGVRLARTLRSQSDWIGRIGWSPDGTRLATPSWEGNTRVWDPRSGECLLTIESHAPYSAAFSPDGKLLAIGAGHGGRAMGVWDARRGALVRQWKTAEFAVASFISNERLIACSGPGAQGSLELFAVESSRSVWSKRVDRVDGASTALAVSPSGTLIAYGTGTELLFVDVTGSVLQTVPLAGSQRSVAFSPDGRTVVAGTKAGGIAVLTGAFIRVTTVLEGHTDVVTAITFSADGRLMASHADDGSTRLWDPRTWQCVAVIDGPPAWGGQQSASFSPSEPLLAMTRETEPVRGQYEHFVELYEIDVDRVLSAATDSLVRYTSAKIVLLGESGVGKTGLGWRLSHGEFKEYPSTHGQQFWLLDELGTTRADGAECEAILWDLAGQPDYRLIHALFVDDADLALVVLDPTRDDDPLRTVDYWLRQLGVGRPDAPRVILVAARADRGGPRITDEELWAFCRARGIEHFVLTSALTGRGIAALVERMKTSIDWEARPATLTTSTFKEIKDYVLGLKEASDRDVILSPAQLRARLERDQVAVGFTDAEMTTAVRNLANHGYVTWLDGSTGDRSILLAPELLNNLAASIVLEARRNPKGLGSLEERPLLAGEHLFPELTGLAATERDLLLDSAVAMFLSHNVCFRNTDPLSGRTYLVFPDLINLQRPAVVDDVPVEEAVSYGVTGATENLYASLVVLLGYTSTFTRTDQWRNHARYVVSGDLVCDLRTESEPDGELTFIVSFGLDVAPHVRTLFQSLVEGMLSRRDLIVRSYPLVRCANGHTLPRGVLRERVRARAGFTFCPVCGERITLPGVSAPIDLTASQVEVTVADRRVASERSRFEEAVFRLATSVRGSSPSCFISYAWGDAEQERWVEHSLAADLAKGGLTVILDRWENARFGASVPRFVDRAHEADRVILVGTPAYKTKYANNEPMGGFVVAAEAHLIGMRMIGTEEQKASVVPVLLAGEPRASFPPLLQGRVYADFRDPARYFGTAFDLMLDLHGLDRRSAAAVELRRYLDPA